jgi:hypothetical protein
MIIFPQAKYGIFLCKPPKIFLESVIIVGGLLRVSPF